MVFFPYGYPRVLCSDFGGDQQYVYLHVSETLIFCVSQTSVELWSGGMQRIRLSECVRDEIDLSVEGFNTCAIWSQHKNTLAVLTSQGHLHLYSVHTWKDTLLPSSTTSARDIQRVDVYLRSSIHLGDEVQATCLAGDARHLLLGCRDGALATLTWLGKVQQIIYPLDSSLREGSSNLEVPLPALSLSAWTNLTGRPAGSSDSQEAAHPTTMTDPGLFATAPRSSSLDPLTLQQDSDSDRIVAMDFCEHSRFLSLVLGDGSVALCVASQDGSSPLRELSLARWVCGAGSGACIARIGATAQLLAVGKLDGVVDLYRLHSSAAVAVSHGPWATAAGLRLPQPPLRSLCLISWGHKPSQTGGVSQIEWSPDGCGIAVGYSREGLAVWSPSGCRLMCSLRQTSEASSVSNDAPQGMRHLHGSMGSFAGSQQQLHPEGGLSEPTNGGVAALAWGPHGYQLMVAEAHSSRLLIELQFARMLPNHHRVATASAVSGRHRQHQSGREVHVLQGHDRLLLIAGADINHRGHSSRRLPAGDDTSGGSTADLTMTHVQLPHLYISSNWPLQHVALSETGADIAVAGRRGLALYNRPTEKWRLFGDVSQERQICCKAISWLLNTIIVVCNGPDPDAKLGGRSSNGSNGSGGGYELLLLPKYHLDLTSLLCRHTLTQPPLAMDCVGNHILLASEPLEISLMEVHLEGVLSASSNPKARLQLVREISLLDIGRPLLHMALVPPTITNLQQRRGSSGSVAGTPAGSGGGGGVGKRKEEEVGEVVTPWQCVLLRWGGLMSVLDLARGSEVQLSSEVECFWLSSSSTETTPSQQQSAHPVPQLNARLQRNASTLSQHSIAVSQPSQLHHAPSSKPPLPTSPKLATSTLSPKSGAAGGRSSATSSPQFTFPGTQFPSKAPPVVPVSGAAGSGGGGFSVVQGRPGLPPIKAGRTASGEGLDTYAGLEVSHPGTADGNWNASAHNSAAQGHKSDVELPWWSYGPGGMQLWFPSLMASQTFAPRTDSQSSATDIELEFDQEVYPIGISLADDAIVGVTQRIMRGPAGSTPAKGPHSLLLQASIGTQLPCFHPIPESQPVLPCLMRRLLQRGAFSEALNLARRHEFGPHFTRSLEWLLFTALEMETSKPSKGRAAQPHRGMNESYHLGRAPLGEAEGLVYRSNSLGYHKPTPVEVSPLLSLAAELIRQFGSHADVVVSVARKTDAALWPALFSAVGTPSALLDSLVEKGALASASCCLLVIDRLEGAAVAHLQALRLIRAAMTSGQYSLTGELLRFIIPPGEVDDMLAVGLARAGSIPGGILDGSDAAATLRADSSGSSAHLGRYSSGAGLGGLSSLSLAGSSSGGAGSKMSPSDAGRSQQISWLGWLMGYTAANADASSTAAAAVAAAAVAEGSSSRGPEVRASPSHPHGGAASGNTPAFQESADEILAAVEAANPRLIRRNSSSGSRPPPSPRTRPSTGPLQSNPSRRVLTSTCETTTSPGPASSSPRHHHSSNGNSGMSQGMTPAIDACHLLAEHGWALLEAGRLVALGQLAGSSAFLGGGLSLLMGAHRESFYASEGCAAVSVLKLLSCVASAVQELPVWNATDVETEALGLLQLCRDVGAKSWEVALSLLLVDLAAVSAFKQAEPQVWAAFVALLVTEPRLTHLLEIVRILAGGIMEDEGRLSTDISESEETPSLDNDANLFASVSQGNGSADAMHH